MTRRCSHDGRQTKMAHCIENRDGVYSFAFTGERSEIWHKLGQELPFDAGRDAWLAAAGFDYHVEKVPAIASLNGAMFDHLPPENRFVETDKRFTVRQDNGHVLGIAGEGDRKSTRLNSSHMSSSYAVFCLNKKKLMRSSMASPGTVPQQLIRAYVTRLN